MIYVAARSTRFRGAGGGVRLGAAVEGCAPVRGMAPPAGDAGSELLLSGIAEQLLAEYPENATALGLDTGARAVLKSQLTDRSPEGRRRLAAAASGRLAQLKAIDKSGLEIGRAHV